MEEATAGWLKAVQWNHEQLIPYWACATGGECESEPKLVSAAEDAHMELLRSCIYV